MQIQLDYLGYLVMAFRSGTEEPIGTFDQISDGQTLDCTGAVKVIDISL